MKAKSSFLVGILLLTSLLFITGCNDGYSGAVDTVITLGTPSVNGIAYPGVNYVYWDKVANAKNGYHLDIYEDDTLNTSQSRDFNEDTTYFIDTDLQNNVKKTYKISAIGDNQARSLYYTESGKGAVTLTGILPPSTTKAIDLALYEKGYNPDPEKVYEFTDEEKEKLLSEDTITVVQDEDGESFCVSFPVKPYLSYKIYAEYGNDYEMFGRHSSSALVATFTDVAYKNNTTATVKASVPVSGDYTIYVKASSLNSNYVFGNEIKAKDKVSFSTIDLSTSYAALVDEDLSQYTSDTSGIIYWTPAKLLDGSYVPASYYKIYKTVTGKNDYSSVTAEVKEYTSVTSTEKLYYIEDTKLDASKTYTYRFVITDGTKYAQLYTEISTIILKSIIDTLDLQVQAKYIDESNIAIGWIPNTLADGSTAAVSAYTVYRKVQGSDDSTYVKVAGAIKSASDEVAPSIAENTYYIIDTVADNTVAYNYLISLNKKDGTVSKTLNKTIAVEAYKDTYEKVSDVLSVNYIKEDTARVLWTPVKWEGKALSTSDYKLYRKDYWKDMTDYSLVKEEIKEAYDQSGKTVYYVDNLIPDTSSTYVYLLEYKINGTIYQTTQVLFSYSKAVVLGAPAVSFYAAENDGIENDAYIEIKISDEQKLSAIKYIKLDSTNTTALLDADYPEKLLTKDAAAVKDGSTTTYTWTISDVEAGTYISVVSIVDGYARYVTTSKASASEPEFTAETTGSNISIELLDSDDDGLSDDAFVIVTMASAEKNLSSVKYANGDSIGAVIDVSIYGTSLTYSSGYAVYAFTITDAVSKANPYFAVSAVISEEGKKDAEISKVVVYSKGTSSFAVSDILIIENDDDGLVNDVYFGIYAAPEQKVTITYAVSNTIENAKLLLSSAEAKVLVSNLTGYKFYEFSAEKYDALKNLPLGKYIAFALTATDDDATVEVTKVVNSTSATYDKYAGLRTEAPIFNMTKLAADKDGLENDVYITVEVYKTQTLEELIYTTAVEDLENLESLRLDSVKTVDITKKLTKKYETADKVIYETILKDFATGTRVAARATAGEPGKVSTSVTKKTTAVTENVVVLSKTADILDVSQGFLKFTSYDNDSHYNDIQQDAIRFTIGIDQKIESIRWAKDVSVEAAKLLLRTDSTKASAVTLPTEYQLNTQVVSGVSILTKTYTLYVPGIKDIPDGDIVLASIIISEPGKLDNEMFISTEKYTLTSVIPVYESFEVPGYASVRAVQDPDYYAANDSKNYEYVHVLITDHFLNDDIGKYKFTLERTYEDIYQNGDAVWETIPENVSFYYDDVTKVYKFDKWYKDIPVGKYVYRLTKTRISSGEKVFTDIAVTVDYHVVAPELSFSSYESENIVLAAREYMDMNYDYLDKYDYDISYTVVYKSGDEEIITDPEPLTGWSWEAEKDEYGNETGYYNLKDAVIKNINREGYFEAYVTPSITKTRKINTYRVDTKTKTLQINWGLTAEIATGSDIGNIQKSEATVDGIKYVTFLVATGYDSYTWYVDSDVWQGNLESPNNSITVNVNNISYGSHDIFVVAKKNGISYSTSISYTK